MRPAPNYTSHRPAVQHTALGFHATENIPKITVEYRWVSAGKLRMFTSFTAPSSFQLWKRREIDRVTLSVKEWLIEVKIHYVEKGDNTKPLMLFVHGFPEIWYSWWHQMKEFSTDYWTVALDMRGYGDSDKPSGVSSYRMEHLVTDLKEFIEALGRRKCILVAHDWGGAIAWQFVLKYLEMWEKYIIMDAPHPFGFRNYILSNVKQFLMSWDIFFFQLPYLPEIPMRSYDMKNFANMAKKMDSKSQTRVTDEDIETYKYIFGKPGAYTAPINYYRANLGRKNLINLSTDRKDLPGLLISRETDKFLSLELLDLAQKNEPNLKVEVVKGANHFVQQDDPESVNEIMTSFLKE